MQPIRQLRQGVQDLQEIDKELTQLRKVTGETLDTMSDFAHEANEIAIAMGRTTQEVIEQSTAWARLGYTIQESADLAKESMMLSVVGNMEAEEATSALVSTLKAYNMEAEEARRITDKVNEVGNNFAISQADVTDILERSSAAMREANNSLAETIALGTGAQEIQQDSRRVGRSAPLYGNIQVKSWLYRGNSRDGQSRGKTCLVYLNCG